MVFSACPLVVVVWSFWGVPLLSCAEKHQALSDRAHFPPLADEDRPWRQQGEHPRVFNTIMWPALGPLPFLEWPRVGLRLRRKQRQHRTFWKAFLNSWLKQG